VSAGGFVKLPTALLYDPDLPGEVLRAYAGLARYAIACSSDTFELTGEAFGTLLGRSRRQADRLMAELITRGLAAVEGNRGRARPNRITVLDPEGCVFAGLHVERASPDLSKQAWTDPSKPGWTDPSMPIDKEVEDERRQRRRGEPLPSPVDNGGAPRPPRPPQPAECGQHRGQPAHNCAPCRSERIASTGPPF
jgi:hypothetical protein